MEKNIIKSFDKFLYVKDKHDNVWKYIPNKDHFIKISPWKDREDRRVNRFQIEQKIIKGELVQYSNKQGIKEIINKRWDETDVDWQHGDDHFFVNKRTNDDDYFKAKEHKFRQTYKDRNGVEHEYFNSYRLVFYNGQLYWSHPYHYWPQVVLWEFESEDKEPDVKSEMRWTKGYHLRPIWSEKHQDYI